MIDLVLFSLWCACYFVTVEDKEAKSVPKYILIFLAPAIIFSSCIKKYLKGE
jgi:hypothetical protein